MKLSPEELKEYLRPKDKDLQEMSRNLPIYPPVPITDREDFTVEEFFPNLDPQELDKLFEYYQAGGGFMKLHRESNAH